MSASVKEAAQVTPEAAAQKVDPSTAVPTEEVPEPEKEAGDKPAETEGKEASKDGESKPDESAAKDPKGENKDAPKEIVLKAPEGSLLDASRVEAISVYAKEKGLSQDAAQAILEHESAAVETLAKRNQSEWLEELRSDKEFGGQSLNDNGAVAYQAAEKWFGPDFVKMLKSSHLNNYPPLFRGLVRIAKASANDSFVHASNQGAGNDVSEADLFYGQTNS